jgi:hypothetical protein
MIIPIERHLKPERFARIYDGEYNPSQDQGEFEDEFRETHSLFKQWAEAYFYDVELEDDDQGVSLSPIFFNSSRKLGIIVDNSSYQNKRTCIGLASVLRKFSNEYMITLDAYCESGQVYACFTKESIHVRGTDQSVSLLGLSGMAQG